LDYCDGCRLDKKMHIDIEAANKMIMEIANKIKSKGRIEPKSTQKTNLEDTKKEILKLINGFKYK
jgi:hypothetical protein